MKAQAAKTRERFYRQSFGETRNTFDDGMAAADEDEQ